MEDSKRNLLIVSLAGVAVILIITNIFFYQKLRALNHNPQAETQAQTQELIGEVGKLMVLPTEAPTIATVSDPEKLKGQPFFEKAQIGDKVLIYAAARKAVLYSPSQKKIIEVAPLIIGQAPATEGTTATTGTNQ